MLELLRTQRVVGIIRGKDTEAAISTGRVLFACGIGLVEVSLTTPRGLDAIGDNLFLETAASGTPIQGTANSEGFGTTLQRYLEAANVNAVVELSDLIAAQRAYEMNARVVTAADEMSQTTSSMFR